MNQGKPAVCGHNAATGREQTLPHIITPATRSRRVVVIGGGPAGLEAARVSAQRGHVVTLFEASDRLGGQIVLAAKGRTRRQIWGIADWLISEVQTLGVDLHLNTYVEAEDVTALAPDLVVVATGGWPDVPHIEGAVRPTGSVLLFDETGDQPTAVTADVLAQLGCSVRVITPDRTLLHDLGPTTSAVALRDLTASGVGFTCLTELAAVTCGGNQQIATLRHVLTGETTTQQADQIVIEHGATPQDALFHTLKPASLNNGQLSQTALVNGSNPFADLNSQGSFYLARVGDAVASRNIHAAVLDALRVCIKF